LDVGNILVMPVAAEYLLVGSHPARAALAASALVAVKRASAVRDSLLCVRKYFHGGSVHFAFLARIRNPSLHRTPPELPTRGGSVPATAGRCASALVIR
jgi:hypothetical protein